MVGLRRVSNVGVMAIMSLCCGCAGKNGRGGWPVPRLNIKRVLASGAKMASHVMLTAPKREQRAVRVKLFVQKSSSYH